MKIKKFLIVLMILAALFSLLSYAEESKGGLCSGYIEFDESFTFIPDTDESSSLFGESFRDYLLEHLKNVDAEINISQFGYTVNDVSAINNLLTLMVYSNYDIYYVLTGFSYNYYTGSGILANLYPMYSTTNKDEINANVKAIESRLDEIASYTDDGMNDLQKLITVYDRLILEAEYDNSLKKRTVKDLLIDGTAVCAGYASALYALADEFDIPCGFVRSSEMNHVWNVLYIDGEWYHADVTWDDPVPDKYSRVNHKYFLKSDNWMRNLGNHYDFSNSGADSEKYDNAFWNDINSSIITIDGNMYCITGKSGNYSLCFYDEEGTKNDIYSFNEKWYSAPNSYSYWPGAYSGLCLYDNRFYFNTATTIISVDLNGKHPKTVYKLDDTEKCSIYGCYTDGETLKFGVGKKDAPNSSTPIAVESLDLSKDEEVEEYITGDLTGDESIDINDAILLLQYSMFPDDYPIEYSGNVDFTGDGSIDLNDAILLLQHSMFPEDYPLNENTSSPETDVLFRLSGESFSENSFVWGENNYGIEVVENPDSKNDKVLYLETNIKNKQAWNYFWHPCKWVPGERYLISFSVRAGDDALGNPITSGSIGINVRTNGTDFGIGSIDIEYGEWVDIKCIYTIPSNIDTSKDMKFGIFANPVEVDGYSYNLAWSYYLDNISIVTYGGDEADGFID